jgi:nuclear pore complex protein Nup107
LFTAAGAQEALHPLRRTADRVTRQIEAFADKLDQFKRQNSNDEFNNAQAAYKLVASYRDLANNAIKEIEKQQIVDRAATGFRSNGTQDTKSAEEIRRLQLESDTWRLLLNLISIDDPSSRARYKAGQQTAFQELHRYSTDREIWEQFLNADQYGLECVIAMRWLEETSKTGDQNLDGLITDMETQAQRGQGLWTHGWLYTKEAIKGHKRLRAWPQPLEPNDPGISRTLLSNDEQKPLVTQLDPDAIIRQNHTLEKQDQSFELATWATCWKMLRQGENWTKIREWAEGHLEGWRAVSLCGSSVDPKSASTQYPADDGHTRLMNSRAQDSWRSACSALTRNNTVDDFQRAVYALLAGETDAAAAVCCGWDDYLYVFFNRVVLSRYQGFCRQFQRKLSHSPNTPVAFKPEPAGHAELQKYLVYLKGNERVSGETRNPFRNIQAAILSQGYDSFFPALAQAVSHVCTEKFGKNSIVPELAPKQVEESFLIAADDEEALKIATHVYVVASARGYARADTHFIETASVLVAGHIANLEERGLFRLIPLYASLLPTAIGHSVLAKILIDIVDPKDKIQQVRLAEKYHIDIKTVLDVQWSWAKQNVSAIDHSRGVTGYSRVSRRADGSKGLVSPKADLIGESVAEEDDKMIRSLEWLRVTDGQWDKICELGSWLYRQFFRKFASLFSFDLAELTFC